MQERIQLDSEVSTVDQFTQLNEFAKGQFVVNIQLWRLNKLVIRFVGEVKNFAPDINAVDKSAERQKFAEFERSLNFAEMKLDFRS